MARIALFLPLLCREGASGVFGYALADALEQDHDVDVICANCQGIPPVGVRVVVVGGLPAARPDLFTHSEQPEHPALTNLTDHVPVKSANSPHHANYATRATRVGYPDQPDRLDRSAPLWGFLRFKLNAELARRRGRYDLTVALGPALSSDIRILPDTRRFAPPSASQRAAIRDRLNLTPQDVIISTVAHEHNIEGPSTLINALAFLPSSFSLLVTGLQAPSLCEAQARRLGVWERLLFLGRVKHMVRLYHTSDLFALPVADESCSTCALEAWACGLKTLTSDQDGAAAFLPPQWVIPHALSSQDVATRLLDMHKAPCSSPFSITPNSADLSTAIATWVKHIEARLKHATRVGR